MSNVDYDKDKKREYQLTSVMLRNDWFKGKNVQRFEDEDSQFKGIDLIVNGVKIDLKAQTDYIGNPTHSFCLELSTLDRNCINRIDGWFLDPKKETEDYGFIWVPKGSVADDVMKPEAIEYMQVSKKSIENYVYSICPKHKLIALMQEYIKNPNKLPQHLNSYVKIEVANKKQKPVILVVNKDIYKSMAKVHFTKNVKL